MSTPSLAGPSKDFLCYLTGVSLEKLLRLDRILDRQHEALEVEYHGVIATLKEAVSRSKELLADNSTVIGEILGDPEVDELQRLALATTLQNIVRFFYGIHEYFVFLPREAVEREVFFALRNCFGGEWDRAQPSVILTSIYNAFEYRFDDVMKNIDVLQQKLPDIAKVKRFSPGSCILELAIIDRDNPLAWPILAHEFGHSLDDTGNISASIVDAHVPGVAQDNQLREICVSWTAEVFADLVAARAIGPAAMLPIVAMELGLSPILKGPSQASRTHPPTTFRFSLFRKYLTDREVRSDLFQSIWSLYSEDQDRKYSTLPDKQKKAREQESKMVDYVLNLVAPAIQARVDALGVKPFTKENLARLEALEERIAAGEPIPSFRAVPDETIRQRIADLEARPNAKSNEIEETLGLLSERPVESSEILTAGWLQRQKTYRFALAQVFKSSKADFTVYSDYLLHLDELLLKSLQLASVHESLAKYASL